MSVYGDHGRGCVVIGVDNHGEPSGPLQLAADEAQRRGVDLAIVTVLRPSIDSGLDLVGLHRNQNLAQATALQGLHGAAAAVHASHPELSVATFCLGEGEVGANREPLLRAELLVIGTQDRYGRQALVLGSVSWLLLNNSRCPVLAVPNHPAHSRRGRAGEPPLIVVGVSEHPSEATVIQAAYAESIGRSCEVLLVHAYSLRAGESTEQARERARMVLADYASAGPSDTRVSVAVVEDDPAAVLLQLAVDATLLVIGGRTGALSGLVRGSVSLAILEAVPCPVLAVPRKLSEPRPGPVTGFAAASPQPARNHPSQPTTSTS